MITNNNKLDDKVKSALSNYRAKESSDWARMEKMLSASGMTSKKRKLSYSLSMLIGALVICGAYLFYSNSKSTPKVENNVVTEPAAKVEAPVNNAVETPAVSKTDAVKEETKASDEAKVMSKTEFKEKTAKVDKKIETMIKKEKAATKEESKMAVPTTITTMGNQPIMGDMLDSQKGVVGQTKESKELQKKAVQKTSEAPIKEWKYFINEAGKRDSVKKKD